MKTRTWILLITVLLMPLSGCIAQKDDLDSENDPGSTPNQGNETDDPPIPEPNVTEVHSKSWTGSQTLQESFSVPDGHDYLIAGFGQTGQLFGHPVIELGGEAMDGALFSNTNGAYGLTRTLPADLGDGRIRLDGMMNGVGRLEVHAVTDIVPPAFLEMGWSGQRTDMAFIEETTIRFFVPEGIETLRVDLAGTGQTLLGMRILDPDGEEIAALGPGNGPQSEGREADAVAGLWSLVLEGSTNGPWGISVVPVDPVPGEIEG